MKRCFHDAPRDWRYSGYCHWYGKQTRSGRLEATEVLVEIAEKVMREAVGDDLMERTEDDGR